MYGSPNAEEERGRAAENDAPGSSTSGLGAIGKIPNSSVGRVDLNAIGNIHDARSDAPGRRHAGQKKGDEEESYGT